MKLKLAAIAALLTISTSAFALDNRFDRTLSVSVPPDVYVATGSGSITIHSGPGNQVHIVGHVHAGWYFGWSSEDGWSNGSTSAGTKSRIDRILADPPIQQDGNTIKIGLENNHDLYHNISIDYDISIPGATALNLHSGSGDVVIDGGSPRYLSASSGSGNVRAKGIHGPAELSSGSGNVEIEQNGPGDVKAKSGSGDLRIHGFNGGLTARTGSGEIEADGRLTGPANLASGSGNVRLHLNADARFELEASTGSGDIHVHFPGAAQQSDYSRHHLTTSINGGGPPLEVRTGSGDITIDSH